MSQSTPAKIYIVDDNPANLDILSSMLEPRGYAIETFSSGQALLSAAENQPPDLFLLDVSMPVMDGFEVCRQLKADSELADIPVIFVSASNLLSDKVRAFDVGGVDYISKPYYMDEIHVRVNNQLTLHQQKRQLQERFDEIQHLQSVVKTFLSQSAWQSMEMDLNAEAPHEPEYQNWAILFTDVAGFTKLSEAHEPNTVVATLSLYMNALSRIVYQFNGEVDKYLGDGMLAFFRKPSDAVTAADHILARVDLFNKQQAAREDGIPLPTRVGIATGRAMLALIGSRNRREYTLLGDRVNVAARLQELAPPGRVAIDQATYQAAGSPDYESQRVIVLKGKAREERVYILRRGV